MLPNRAPVEPTRKGALIRILYHLKDEQLSEEVTTICCLFCIISVIGQLPLQNLLFSHRPEIISRFSWKKYCIVHFSVLGGIFQKCKVVQQRRQWLQWGCVAFFLIKTFFHYKNRLLSFGRASHKFQLKIVFDMGLSHSIIILNVKKIFYIFIPYIFPISLIESISPICILIDLWYQWAQYVYICTLLSPGPSKYAQRKKFWHLATVWTDTMS